MWKWSHVWNEAWCVRTPLLVCAHTALPPWLQYWPHGKDGKSKFCLSNVYTSLRQASEWGMRGLQGTFPWCKKRLPSDSEKRKQVLECIILVHNYQTQIVGHNQISTVFAPEYRRVINFHGYDRISQCYLQPGDYDTDDEAELMQKNFDDGGEDDI